MTNKVYRSAQGKMVDLGTIVLQNEHVRAVGNMKVNARGDKIDSLNQVIETRTERIQRHNDRTSTKVSAAPQSSSNRARAKKKNIEPDTQIHSRGHVADVEPDPVQVSTPEPSPPAPVEVAVSAPPPVARTVEPPPSPVQTARPQPQPQPKAPEVDLKNPVRPTKSPAAGNTAANSGGGLAGAIARSREIKQELDRSRRQQAQDRGLRKI